MGPARALRWCVGRCRCGRGWCGQRASSYLQFEDRLAQGIESIIGTMGVWPTPAVA